MQSRTEHASAAAVDRALVLLSEATGSARTYKTDRDYATETDYAIEDELRRLLADLTPEVGFLGEERGHTGSPDHYWCLDPIDGTTNFSRGLPTFGVSLALIHDQAPTFGEIALPRHGERYVARAEGAYLNGERIKASITHTLREALVSIGDFATGPGSVDKNRGRLQTVERLANDVGRIRMMGSVATDLAWLAAGRIDAVVVHSNKPWDMAAGVALARASGATVTHHDGTPYTLSGPNVLAAAPHVHAAVIDQLN